MDELSLLGWYLSRPVFKPEKFREHLRLLSEVVLSGASCIGTTHPSYLEDITSIGEMAAHYDFIMDRSTGEYWGDTCYLKSPQGAAEVNERCFGGSLNIYGLAVPNRFKERLFAEIGAETDEKKPKTVWTEPLGGKERILGYDVMGSNYGWTTFQCNGLEKTLFEVFGVRLNEWSLIATLEQAEAFAEHINAHDLGEPGWYAPYAVILPAEEKYRLNLPPISDGWEDFALPE